MSKIQEIVFDTNDGSSKAVEQGDVVDVLKSRGGIHSHYFLLIAYSEACVAFLICVLSIAANVACLYHFQSRKVHRQLVIIMSVLTANNIALALVNLLKAASRLVFNNKYWIQLGGEFACQTGTAFWMAFSVMAAFATSLMTNEQRYCMTRRRNPTTDETTKRIVKCVTALAAAAVFVTTGLVYVLFVRHSTFGLNVLASIITGSADQNNHVVLSTYHVCTANSSMSSTFALIFIELSFFITACVLPIFFMAFNYSWIYWRCLRRILLISPDTRFQAFEKARRRRQIVVYTMVATFCVFLACTVPSHVTRYLAIFDSNWTTSEPIKSSSAIFLSSCLINLRATVNPFLQMVFCQSAAAAKKAGSRSLSAPQILISSLTPSSPQLAYLRNNSDNNCTANINLSPTSQRHNISGYSSYILLPSRRRIASD